MINYTLEIGDLKVCKSQNISFTCFGLGSCVALFLQDRSTGLSGGAHIFLPQVDLVPQIPGKYFTVKAAVDKLIQEFKHNGSTALNLRAKVVGGATLRKNSYDTGRRNAEELITYLQEKLVYIAATDVGGYCSRTARFDCHTGLLKVRIPEIKKEEYF